MEKNDASFLFAQRIESENPKDADTEIYIKGKYATIVTTDDKFLDKIINVGDKCTEVSKFINDKTQKVEKYKVVLPATYILLIKN